MESTTTKTGKTNTFAHLDSELSKIFLHVMRRAEMATNTLEKVVNDTEVSAEVKANAAATLLRCSLQASEFVARATNKLPSF